MAAALDLNYSQEATLSIALPYCLNRTSGRIPSIGYSLVAINLLEIIINILHICVLRRLPAIKGSPYLVLLCFISLGDILNGVGSCLRLVLSRPDYFRGVSLAGFIAYDIAVGFLISGRYYLMLAAAVERYMALCRPMDYNTSLYITKLNLWIVLLWVFSFVPYAVRDTLASDTMCFNPRIGPFVPSGRGVGLINSVALYVVSAVTAVVWARVLVELYRMRRRSVSVREQQVKRGTIYLVLITVIFYLCFLPPFIQTSLLFRGHKMSPVQFYLNTMLLFPIYGIVNTVIYGWMSPAYRKQVWVILSCQASLPGRSNRVDPHQNTSSV